VIVMSQRPMFEIKCTDCGDATTVPFKPTPGKPVYCRACFSKHVTRRPENIGSGNAGFAQNQVWARRRENAHAVREEAPVSVFQRV
jgi:CxxC-x17-CxxC domain-containing protein